MVKLSTFRIVLIFITVFFVFWFGYLFSLENIDINLNYHVITFNHYVTKHFNPNNLKIDFNNPIYSILFSLIRVIPDIWIKIYDAFFVSILAIGAFFLPLIFLELGYLDSSGDD